MHITSYYLPLHTGHMHQLLDKALSGTLKTPHATETDKFMYDNPGKSLTHISFSLFQNSHSWGKLSRLYTQPEVTNSTEILPPAMKTSHLHSWDTWRSF